MNAIDVAALKDRIKDKFDSLTRFAMIAKIEHADMNRMFTSIAWRIKRGKELHTSQVLYLAKLSKKCDTLQAEVATSKELTIVDLIKIKKEIEKAGGVISFCEDNPEFKQSTIYEFMDGKRTFRGKVAMKLMKKFKLV